jgi:hypothetical protein
MSWYCPAFWWRDSKLYLVFSQSCCNRRILLGYIYMKGGYVAVTILIGLLLNVEKLNRFYVICLASDVGSQLGTAAIEQPTSSVPQIAMPSVYKHWSVTCNPGPSLYFLSSYSAPLLRSRIWNCSLFRLSILERGICSLYGRSVQEFCLRFQTTMRWLSLYMTKCKLVDR